MQEMSNTRPQTIAVIGMGGIGSAFAFQLARVGHHNVTAIARPGSPRLQQLLDDGGVTNTDGEHAAMHVADCLDEGADYDLILVTLPAHRLAPVLEALQRSTCQRIQFMINTFEPERIRDSVGADRCFFGMPFIQASLVPGGRLKMKIGAGGQKSKVDSEAAVALFNTGGLPAVFEPEMLLWLRSHAPLCVAFESVSALAVSRKGGIRWAEALTVAKGLQESLTLIQRLGYRIYPAGKVRLHAAPALVPASLLWFLSRVPSFRELLATGIDECRALIGVMTQEASGKMPVLSIERINSMAPVLYEEEHTA